MISRADRFALQFAILFLCVLLSMFALYHLLSAYDGFRYAGTWLTFLLGEPQQPDMALNFTEAFRVNLFLIDLSLLLVVESVLIFLFVRYTVQALLISCVGILGITGFGRGLLSHKGVSFVVLMLARNQHTRLEARDAVLLVALNALLISFLIAMMHHYRLLELEERLAKATGKPSPKPGSPSPAPATDNPSPDATTPAPDKAPAAREPDDAPPPNR